MAGETNLDKLLKSMKPRLNEGEFVFCVVQDIVQVNLHDAVFFLREAEGYTVVLNRQVADSLALDYNFVASWITLTVHSALDAVGLTAAFSNALAQNGISCNVVAGYYHDHIFVAVKDGNAAMSVLNRLTV